MPQGVLPFKYVEEKKSSGMTARAGLPVYLDLIFVARVGEAIQEHLLIRKGKQGWKDVEIILSLVLLNLAGGESVDDLKILREDEGFVQVLLKALTQGLRQRDRRKLEKLWNEKLLKGRAIPSSTAIFRYLKAFHDKEQEKKRVKGTAFIPRPNEQLKGLSRINAELVKFIQMHAVHHEATLDIDATIVETHKEEALHCYKGYKSYQPLNIYWDEQSLIVHSEFRDGNVPAGFEQLRVFKEALAMMPPDVTKVATRSDTAGYQVDFLRYCAEGRNERFGVIDFVVGADVTIEFKHAVAKLSEDDWKPLYRMVQGNKVKTGQEWAEVCYVPSWVGHSKKGPEYRFIALREPLIERALPGLENQLTFPFPTMEFSCKGRYKLFGMVTNRTRAVMPGDEVIWWYRKRCGKSEEAHSVMKEDFAGGRLPSGYFGVNAAWWGIMILAFNLNSAMKRLVLKGEWMNTRMKAIRFSLINLPGRIIHHGREFIIRLTGGHGSNSLLIQARERILALLSRAPGLT